MERKMSNGEIPEGAGVGLYSIGLQELDDGIVKNDFDPGPNRDIEEMRLFYIDSYHSLYSTFSIDAQASFAGFGGKASASLNFARTITISSRSIYMMLRNQFISREYGFVRPLLTEPARDTL